MKEERTRKGVPWDQPSSSGQSGTVGPGTEMLTPEAYVLRQKLARMKQCAERVNRWLQLSGLDGTEFHRKGHERARLFGQSANTERRKFRPTGAHMLLGPIDPSARYKGRAISCVACRTTISFLCIERCFDLKHRSGRSESQCSWTVNGSIHMQQFLQTRLPHGAVRSFVEGLFRGDSPREIQCRPTCRGGAAAADPSPPLLPCVRERPLIGNFRGDPERQELAERRHSRPAEVVSSASIFLRRGAR